MSKPASNLRLFVAIHPPLDTVQAMLNEMGRIALPPHRPIPADQVHLTLQFIGDTPASELENVMESVRRSAAGIGSFVLVPRRLISLPQRGPARLVALKTDLPPALLELHRRLAHRLAGNLRERDRERFFPHMTLCRFRAPAPDVKVDQPVTIESMFITEFRMMRSVLLLAGAEHRELMRCELDDA